MGLMGLGAAGAVIVASVGAFAVLQIALMVAQGNAHPHAVLKFWCSTACMHAYPLHR